MVFLGKGINVPNFPGDIASPVNGDIWYDTTGTRFRFRQNGATVNLGTGDVVGPASSTDNAIVRFDLTTGKLIQNSVVTISDAGSMVIGSTGASLYITPTGTNGTTDILQRISSTASGGTVSVMEMNAYGTMTFLNYNGGAVMSIGTTSGNVDVSVNLRALAGLSVTGSLTTTRLTGTNWGANDIEIDNGWGIIYKTQGGTGASPIGHIFQPYTAIDAGTTLFSINNLSGNLFSMLGDGTTVFQKGPVTIGSASGATGILNFAGTTSGVVSVKPQAAAGTYNFNLPTTAGNAGEVLTSQGGGATAMTWTTPSGSGDMILASVQTNTGAKTFNSGTLILAGATSGTTIFNAAAVAGTTTITLPGTTGTVALLSTSEAPLGNPGTDNHVLSSTIAGVRSWVNAYRVAKNEGTVLPARQAFDFIGSTVTASDNGTNETTDITISAEPPLGNPGTDGHVLSSTIAGVRSWIASGVGDMVLANVQTVTGLKTFDKNKFAMTGTGAGVTTLSTANTSGTSYTATLQAATGTLAYTSDIPTAGVTTMAAIGATPNANGASISGVTLTLQKADASFGGVVIPGAQDFGTGAKTIGVVKTDVLRMATAATNFEIQGNDFSSQYQFASNTYLQVLSNINLSQFRTFKFPDATGTGLISVNGLISTAGSVTLKPVDVNGYTTTATAAGTTTLTVSSTYLQFFTGTTTQTVALPVVSTLTLGTQFYIKNNSTGDVTVQSSGGNAIIILAGGTRAIVTSIATTGTDATVWSYMYVGISIASGKKLTVSNSITLAGTDATTMTFPTTSATIARTDAANTFTGVQTMTNAALTTPDITTGFKIGGAAASGNIPIGNGTNYVASTPTYPNAASTSGNVITSDGTNFDSSPNVGGWTALKVSGSDFTTTSTSLVNVTGLISGTLSTATLYEFEAVLFVNSTSTAGMAIGVQQSGTGSGSLGVFTGTATSAAATGVAIGSNALNTATAACVLINGDGSITIRGFIKTGSAGSPTISVKILKTTSGTAKAYIGSVFRYRAA